jgi:small subunit ribosomal protein S2
MANTISIEEMMKAGTHFGHQTHRRNPKMDRYIFGVKDGVHIIDLVKTEASLKEAIGFLSGVTSAGGQVIFVGTKRQASDLVKQAAESCGMPYVNERWLGGLLTNYDTIKRRLKYLAELTERFTTNSFEGMTKKERVEMQKEYEVLQKTLGGLRDLRGIPQAIVVVDTIKDAIAIREAGKLGVPVVALADTNANPDVVDYPIPANDDAKKSIGLMLGYLSDACKVTDKPTTSAKSVEAAEEKTVTEDNELVAKASE